MPGGDATGHVRRRVGHRRALELTDQRVEPRRVAGRARQARSPGAMGISAGCREIRAQIFIAGQTELALPTGRKDPSHPDTVIGFVATDLTTRGFDAPDDLVTWDDR